MSPEQGAVHVCRQSRFPHAPKLPAQHMVQGPSKSGKSSALQRLATEVWVHKDGKSCFDRIYVFSASVGKTFEDGIDDTRAPVKRLTETQLIDRTNPNHNAETFFYDELDSNAMQALSDIVDLQFQMKLHILMIFAKHVPTYTLELFLPTDFRRSCRHRKRIAISSDALHNRGRPLIHVSMHLCRIPTYHRRSQ